MPATHASQPTGPRLETRVIDVSDLPYDAVRAYVDAIDGEGYLKRRGDRTLLAIE